MEGGKEGRKEARRQGSKEGRKEVEDYDESALNLFTTHDEPESPNEGSEGACLRYMMN